MGTNYRYTIMILFEIQRILCYYMLLSNYETGRLLNFSKPWAQFKQNKVFLRQSDNLRTTKQNGTVWNTNSYIMEFFKSTTPIYWIWYVFHRVLGSTKFYGHLNLLDVIHIIQNLTKFSSETAPSEGMWTLLCFFRLIDTAN